MKCTVQGMQGAVHQIFFGFGMVSHQTDGAPAVISEDGVSGIFALHMRSAFLYEHDESRFFSAHPPNSRLGTTGSVLAPLHGP